MIYPATYRSVNALAVHLIDAHRIDPDGTFGQVVGQHEAAHDDGPGPIPHVHEPDPDAPPTGPRLIARLLAVRSLLDADDLTVVYGRLLDLVADDPDLSYTTVADALGVTKDSLFKARNRARERTKT